MNVFHEKLLTTIRMQLTTKPSVDPPELRSRALSSHLPTGHCLKKPIGTQIVSRRLH
jgi:hypothetical protein